MLTEEESETLLDMLGTPSVERTPLSAGRSSEPERRVASSRIAGNESGTLPSRKMGRTIQFERLSVARIGILVKYEYGADYLEYWDQLFTFEGLVYEGENGKKVRSKHTPDFLVITSRGIYVDEWKPEHKLLGLEEKGGSRFRREGDGTWKFPAAEHLSEACPRFGSNVLFFSANRRIGCCPGCRRWLGEKYEPIGLSRKEDPEVRLRMAEFVGELLKVLPSLEGKISPQSLSAGIRKAIDVASDGNLSNFAKMIGKRKGPFRPGGQERWFPRSKKSSGWPC